MANERWIFDELTGRYRSEQTGRFIPAARIQQMRDELLVAGGARMAALAQGLADGNLDVGDWERQMRETIQLVFGVQYVFGRGGINAMQADDWSAVGNLVRQQHGFLKGFADDIAAGKLSRAQITVRAELYVGSSVRAHEAGKGAAFGILLPAQPGDGSSECLANDRCHWFLRRRRDGRVEATWVADIDARTCKTCRKRAKDWNPLVLGQPAAVPTSNKLRMPSIQPA